MLKNFVISREALFVQSSRDEFELAVDTFIAEVGRAGFIAQVQPTHMNEWVTVSINVVKVNGFTKMVEHVSREDFASALASSRRK